MKVKLKRLHPLILLAFLSCTQLETQAPESGQADQVAPDLSSIMVDTSLPFYADVSGTAETKAGAWGISLESLLNYSETKTVRYNGGILTQIPFKPYNASKAYFGPKADGDSKNAVTLKRFLIFYGFNYFVVSMVTDREYMETHPDFDYIDKPDYTGAIIFSTLTGQMIKLQVYISGLTVPGEFATGNEGGDMQYVFVRLYGSSPQTKSGEDEEYFDVIPASYCIAYRTDWWKWGDNDDDDNSYDNEHDEDDNHHSGGGGGHGKQGGNGGNGDNSDAEEQLFTVTLSCNFPDHIEMNGSGTYTKGSTVSVNYTKKVSVATHSFSHWAGSFSDRRTPTFTFTISDNVESTAYFDVGKPCRSGANGKMNPLQSMSIAASNDKGNYWGGTFGMTRIDRHTNQPRMHEGLDFYAEPGTPVYAMFDGEIVRADSGYGNNYVDGSFGNQLQIKSTDGKVVAQYAHLQAGKPIATNPRTQSPYAVGDKVQQGDLIGYTGRTGNAIDVPNPHLHFGIKIGGQWTDPRNYINGSYGSTQSSVNKDKGRISNIRCD